MPRRASYAAAVLGIALSLMALAFLGFGRSARAQDALPWSASAIGQVESPLPWRVSIRDAADLRMLAAHYDVWSVDHTQGSAVLGLTGAQAQSLKDVGRPLTPDTTLAAATLTQLQPAALGASAVLSCYRTLSETRLSMQQLALHYPDLVRLVDFGDSWDRVTPGGPAGHDLEAMAVTNRQRRGPKFRMMLIGAIHAREMATAESALRFTERLVRAYGTDPDATWLLDYGELHVAPVVNPDGREIIDEAPYSYWRKNTDDTSQCSWPSYGIDLNRNAPFRWNECEGFGCSSAYACDQTYRGEGPASEPETQALMAYASDLFPDQRGALITHTAAATTSGLYVSLHSYGQLVLYPWGWSSTPAPNQPALDTLGRRFGHYLGYATCQLGGDGCLYQVDGALDDWVYGELGIGTYTFELGTFFFEDCGVFESEIAPNVRDALLYGFKAARRPYQTPSGPEVTALSATPARVLSGDSFILSATVDATRIVPPIQAAATGTAFAVRYSIDAPSWLTSTLLVTGAAGASWNEAGPEGVSATLVTSVETGGWTSGRHLLLVEGRQGSGGWGVPTGVFVDVISPTTESLMYFPRLHAARP